MTYGEIYKTAEERITAKREFCSQDACDFCPLYQRCLHYGAEADEIAFKWLDLEKIDIVSAKEEMTRTLSDDELKISCEDLQETMRRG